MMKLIRIKSDNCTAGNATLYTLRFRNVDLGILEDITHAKSEDSAIDVLIVGYHKTNDHDFLLALNLTSKGYQHLLSYPSTASFTKKIARLAGFNGSEFRIRLYHGFHERKRGGIYDHAGKLLYNHPDKPLAGAFLDYPQSLCLRATMLVYVYGRTLVPIRKKRR